MARAEQHAARPCAWPRVNVGFMWGAFDRTVVREALSAPCGARTWRQTRHRLRAVASARRAFRLRRALLEAVAVGCRVEVLKIVINHSNAGLFAYITFALNQLLYAEQHGLFPVVFFGATSGCGVVGGDASACGPNAYYDEASGPNMWEYYFEQPGNVSLEVCCHALPSCVAACCRCHGRAVAGGKRGAAMATACH